MIKKFIHWIMLFLLKKTSSWKSFHNIIRLFYLNLIFTLLTHLLKYKYPNVLFIIARNSILDKKRFNAFVSDIDMSIIIENGSESNELLKYFNKLKSFLIILDTPEVYYLNEYEELVKIYKNPEFEIIETFWHIRKINWNFLKLASPHSSFEKAKILRSINYSNWKISKNNEFTKNIELSELKNFSSFNFSNKECNICLTSLYLETNKGVGINILLNNDQFEFLNYLMPDVPYQNIHKNLKSLIFNHERLLTLASIRIDESKGIINKEKHLWIQKLEKQISNLQLSK